MSSFLEDTREQPWRLMHVSPSSLKPDVSNKAIPIAHDVGGTWANDENSSNQGTANIVAHVEHNICIK